MKLKIRNNGRVRELEYFLDGYLRHKGVEIGYARTEVKLDSMLAPMYRIELGIRHEGFSGNIVMESTGRWLWKKTLLTLAGADKETESIVEKAVGDYCKVYC